MHIIYVQHLMTSLFLSGRQVLRTMVSLLYASMTVLILDAHARNELHCGAFKLNVDKPVRKFTNFEWQMLLDKP